MTKFYMIISLVVAILSSAWIFSQEEGTHEMTLHDFMEDHVELAEKKFKKGNKEPMRKILEAIPALALADDKDAWEKITTDALASGKYLSSCKSCHVKFKKSYKKSYKKRLVAVPKDILLGK
jgi:hypothetical protein